MDEVQNNEQARIQYRQRERMTGDFLDFDIQAQIESLRNEEAYKHGRNSKTLVKYADFRVVLIVIKAGAHIREHTAAGRIAVQTVAGRIRMRVGGTEFELPTGRLAIIDRNIPHDVEAVDDSAFLLTIAWREGVHDA